MLVCAFLHNFARETAGAARTRLSLRPLFEEGGKKQQTPGETRRGIAKVYPAVIASEAKQSIAQQERKLDCFAALAMTVLKCGDGRPFAYTSTLALSELSWMNSRRGSTTSPISLVKMSSASSTSLTLTCSSERALTSRVVCQSCSGFISPRPL